MTHPEDEDAVAQMRSRLAELDIELARPELASRPTALRRAWREHARLRHVVTVADRCHELCSDLQAARELTEEDPSFADEVQRLEEELDCRRRDLTELLAPSDPLDVEDAIVEILSGEGGEESALFAADLLRMYQSYAESVGWTMTVLDSQVTDLGGFRSVVAALSGTDERPAYGTMKFEGGVHRVQRVPVTESQGRVHTSAVGVLVFPDVDAEQVDLDMSDVRVDVFRSSGPGGQGVNTTDSAVRLTHLPTGIVVSCQNERSQLQNKEQAMRMLRAKLAALAAEQAADEAGQLRRQQVRTVDRSARIRTYNFPENRLTDHRIGYKTRKLDAVLNGELQELLDALHADDLAHRLAQSGMGADTDSADDDGRAAVEGRPR